MYRYDASDIPTLTDRTVFFDANILLYIFWPTGSQWERPYSSIFKKLLHHNMVVSVDFIVISEVVNRVVRIEYKKHLLEKKLSKKNFPFKDFRNSSFGQSSLEDIYNIIKENILLKFSVVGKAFTKADIESFLQIDTLDFSDKAIAKICRDNQYILLTNDTDFSDSNLEILSSHPRLLSI